ncbi:MAG: DUF3515 family protein [Microbacterium sp.]
MRRRILALLLVLAGAVLTGCTPTIHLEPAANANDPLCADVSVRLPDAVGDLTRVWTDAQATAAWGKPTTVIFTCGLEEPAPSTLTCVTIKSVDWLIDDTDYPNLRMTTYGRSPAAQAYVDTTVISGDDALAALASAVSELPKTTECTDPATDTEDGIEAG